jgi:DNA polymerase IV
MFQTHPWPNVILHLDADAFFASVIQAVNPHLKGKPVAVGKERGVATAVSYEAKAFGIKRGMLALDIKKLCPRCVFTNSDYEVYAIFSQKMFNILKSFSPEVEQYSVDEGFADLKGLRRPLNLSYGQMAQKIKAKVENSLGITVSTGISVTKSLAKLASGFRKPNGITVVNGLKIKQFLKLIELDKIWGIGENTKAYLNKLNINNALDFASQKQSFIKKNLTKSYLEIWQELRGQKVYQLNWQTKTSYKGMVNSQTFNPSTNNPKILWAKLLKHTEAVFAKARKYHYSVGQVVLYLKTQQFKYHSIKIRLKPNTSYPWLARQELKAGFEKLWQNNTYYRAAGCYISDLQDLDSQQLGLFNNQEKEEKLKKLYPVLEEKKVDFGTSLYDQKDLRSKPKKRVSLPIISIS